MHSLLISPNLFFRAATVFLALIVGMASIFQPKLGLILAGLPFIGYLFVSYKKSILFMFLLLAPFASVPQLSQNIMGVPGAKPFNLVAALCLASFFFYKGSLLPEKQNSFDKKILLYLLIYFIIFTIASFRTLNYLPTLHMLMPDIFHASAVRHLLSTYIRPALILIPFIFILKHVKNNNEIDQTIRTICFTFFLLSLTILIISIPNFSLISQGRIQAREIFSTFLGLHYNALGSFYISIFPILLHQAFNKKLFDITNLSLAIVAILLLQSRSTIFVMLISTYLFFALTNRKKHALLLTAFLVCFSIYWIPSFLLKTAKVGIDEGDLNSIFTGRINYLWIPLLKEWTGDLGLLLFGKGRYALMMSHEYMRGILPQVTHAHNAFFDFFLNCGLPLLLGAVCFIVKSLKNAWEMGKKMDSPLFWAFFLCIAGYLIICITGRSLMLKTDNLFIFPILALSINFSMHGIQKNENSIS